MSLKIEQVHCTQCGSVIQNDWFFCPSCGASRENYFMQCSRCHHILTEAHFTFCPYCRFKLPKSYGYNQFNSQKTEDFNVFKSNQLIDKNISVNTIIDNLKFDPQAMSEVLFSRRFTLIGILLLILISFTNALVLSLYDSINTYVSYSARNYVFNQFLINFFDLLVILFLFGFFYNILLNFIDVKEDNANYIRIISSYAPLFLLKDGIIVFTFFLAGFFHDTQNNYSLFSNLYVLLFLLIIIYIIFHLTVVTSKSTPLGTIMILFIIFFVLIIVFILGAYYSSFIMNIFFNRY